MIQDDRCANDLQARGPYRNNGTLPLESTVENWGTSLNFAFDLSEQLQLKSITAYRDIRWAGVRDADNTPLTILHTIYDVQADQFSEELQLTYQTEPLTGVFGLYYFEQTSDDIVTVELNPPPPGIQRDSDNNKVDNNNRDPKKRGDRNLYVRRIEIEGPLYPPPPVRPESHRRIFVCMPGEDGLAEDQAARKIVERFANEAFRRPASRARP